MTSVMEHRSTTITPEGVSPQFSRHVVNPAVATALLASNTSNRPVKKAKVISLALAMREGRFVFNGDSIRISRSGILLDGQHRLLAIISADVSMEMLIVTDLPDEVVSTIDQGVPRTVHDILSIRGIKPVQGHAAAATAALMTALDPDLAYMNKDRSLLADYIEENLQEIEPWVGFARMISAESPKSEAQFGARRQQRSIAASPLAALCVYMTREGADTEGVVQFFDGISKGFNMEPEKLRSLTPERVTTLQTLHKRLVAGAQLNRSGGGSSSHTLLVEFAHYITAYNRYVENTAVKVVRNLKSYEPRWWADLPTVSNEKLA